MYINAMGHYVPTTLIGNEHFLELNGLTSDWIEQRTGILSRSRCAEGEGCNSMGFEAVEAAMRSLPYDIKEVDLIIQTGYCVYDTVATLAHQVQRKYDIHEAKAFYLSAACSSFINATETVEAYFKAGLAKKALVICSEHNSYYANETDPKSGHLWGDAAVAFFFSADRVAPTDMTVKGVYTMGLADLGKGPDGVRLRPKEDGIVMPDGRDVFIHACRYMKHAVDTSLANAGLTYDDITFFATHQANKRIVAQVANQMNLPMDRFANNIERYGNTGSASAALVLSENIDRLQPGDRAALMVFGGGYSCGAMIVEK